MTSKSKPLVERFWPKVAKGPGCWSWTASVDKDGYGQIVNETVPRTMLKSHRVSWEFAYGSIEAGLCVLHKCDNPRCVRPEHLFLGTDADNVADMTRKGRNIFQKRNPSSKLSDAQVRSIRQRRSQGESLLVLSKAFNVTEGTISRVANRVRRAEVK